jgi:MFS family permease
MQIQDKPLEKSVSVKKGISAKWRVLTGNFIGYTLYAMEFMLLSLALPFIIREWNLSTEKAGLLATSTLVGVGISALWLGWYSDKYGRKKALILAICIFGAFTSAGALAQNWEQLMILRFLAGLGLGGIVGLSAAFISETWPKHQSGRATSFVMSSWPIGYAIAAILGVFILPAFGWRALFATGLVAFLCALYIYLFVPESEAWMESNKKKMTENKSSKTSLKELFSGKLTRITVLGTLVSLCMLSAYWGINTWLPTYLMGVRGLDAAKSGMLIVVINIGMFIGYQLFGWIADKIGKRKALMLSFFGSAVTVPIFLIVKNVEILFWLGPFVLFFLVFTGIFSSYFSDLYPIHLRSMGVGFCFNIGKGLSAFAPFALGVIASSYGYEIGFAWCAIVLVAAGLLMLLLPETNHNTSTQ